MAETNYLPLNPFCPGNLDPCKNPFSQSKNLAYVGPNLGCTGIQTCDNLTTVIQKLDEKICEGGVATAMSHLKAIEKWLKSSDEEYGLFVEDDVMLELIDTWNFTWEEFYNSLPKGWKVIQLSLIQETPLSEEDMKITKRKWNNWSAQAYLLSREYAQEVVRKHIIGEDFFLIQPDNVIPISENIIFGSVQDGVYTIPLFTENNEKFTSTFYPEIIKTEHKAYQIDCSRFIINWWKSNSSNQLKWIFNS